MPNPFKLDYWDSYFVNLCDAINTVFCIIHYNSPLWSLLLVVDGVAGDGHGVGVRGLPGQRDEPRAGDDGLETSGGAGEAAEAGEDSAAA